MEYVRLYNGINMPLVGFGTWDLRGRDCTEAVKTTLETGYRMIDTAKLYGNEQAVGAGIAESSVPRSEIFLTTKIDYEAETYEAAEASIQDSLNQLGVDYIDLLLIHRPSAGATKMYAALEDAYDRGLVRAIGVSNCNEIWFGKFLDTCRIVPMVNQVETHLLYQKRALQRVLAGNGTVMQAWSPLGGPGLTGRILNDPVLKEIAGTHHVTPAQAALRFLVQRGISVIPKSGRRERQRENLDLFRFSLSEEEMDALAALDRNQTLYQWTEAF